MRPRTPFHGRDHRPGGFDPAEPGIWHYVGGDNEPPFVNGTNAAPTTDRPNPVPMRFRLIIGRHNLLDSDEVAATRHKTLELQGDVDGVAAGDVVFILPPRYRLDYDVPVDAHDDAGTYVPCRLLATGEFIYGVA